MKVILITGCSTGIGPATARHLASRGDRVYATARRADASAELVAAKAADANIRTLALEVTNDGSVLVNNAGGR